MCLASCSLCPFFPSLPHAIQSPPSLSLSSNLSFFYQSELLIICPHQDKSKMSTTQHINTRNIFSLRISHCLIFVFVPVPLSVFVSLFHSRGLSLSFSLFIFLCVSPLFPSLFLSLSLSFPLSFPQPKHCF